MIVQVRYMAQLRRMAGLQAEAVEVAERCTIAALVAQLAEARPALGSVLHSPSLLVFVGDEQAHAEQILHPGDEILLMTPIAGGDLAYSCDMLDIPRIPLERKREERT